MTAKNGSFVYTNYVTGTDKGDLPAGATVINGTFDMGNPGARSTYASSAIVESIDANATTITPSWTPSGKVMGIKAADGTVEEITLTNGSATVTAGTYTKIKYKYDNEVIPQETLPTIKMQMVEVPVIAQTRRLAIYYSTLAAYQLKTELGIDLGDQLAAQATAELQYEIDTEVVKHLVEAAALETDLTWSRDYTNGGVAYISRSQHYESFAETIEKAKAIIYSKTNKFAPNYMVIAPDVLPVLTLTKGFEAVGGATSFAGPYLAGHISGLKVFVSPAMATGEFVVGVKGSDDMTAAVAYCPFMPVVPTQLLGFADGSMSQGFACMDAIVTICDKLVVKGIVED